MDIFEDQVLIKQQNNWKAAIIDIINCTIMRI